MAAAEEGDKAADRVGEGAAGPGAPRCRAARGHRTAGGTVAAAGPHRRRRVEIDDPDEGGTGVFLTNHFALGATTISAVDEVRWQVERSFKALRQVRTALALSRVNPSRFHDLCTGAITPFPRAACRRLPAMSPLEPTAQGR